MAEFQGPVPEGADEQLFRQTGKTGTTDSSGRFRPFKRKRGRNDSRNREDAQREQLISEIESEFFQQSRPELRGLSVQQLQQRRQELQNIRTLKSQRESEQKQQLQERIRQEAPRGIIQQESDLMTPARQGRVDSFITTAGELETREEFIQERTGRILTQRGAELQGLSFDELFDLSMTPGTGVTGMSTFEGAEFMFAPTEEQIIGARTEAGLQFGELPKERRQKLQVGEVKVGIQRGLINLGEGIIDFAIPRQEIIGQPSPGEAFFEDFRFVREAKETPTGFLGKSAEIGTEVAVIVPFLGQAAGRTFKVAKSEGLGPAVGELALELSPIRPAGKFFAPDIIKEPFKVDVVDIGGPKGIRAFEFTGRGRVADEITIRGGGFSGKVGDESLAGGFASVQRPFVEFRGGRANFGREEIIVPFTQRQVGPEFKGAGIVEGGRGIEFDIIPTETITRFDITRGFSGRRKISELDIGNIRIEEDIIGSGPLGKTRLKEGPINEESIISLPKDFFAQVTGRSRRITISSPVEDTGVSGFEGFQESKGFTTFQGGSRRSSPEFFQGLDQIQVQDVASVDLSSVIQSLGVSAKPIVKVSPRPPVISPRLGDVFVGQGQFAGQGQFELTQEVGFGAFGSQQLMTPSLDFMNLRQGEFPTSFISPAFGSRARQNLRGRALSEFQFPAVLDIAGQRSGLIEKQLEIPALGLGTAQKFDFEIPTPTTPILPIFTFGGPRKFRGSLFPFFSGLEFGGGRGSSAIGRRGFERVPSIEAVALGITGSINDPLERTGLFTRPISRKKTRRNSLDFSGFI